MAASVSAESASLASVHSRRTWATAARTPGSPASIVEGAGARVAHVGEHRFVEVHPAQVLDALGPAQELEAVGRLAQDGRIEGAPTQVVDGDHGARLDALGRRVGDGRGLRLGDGRDLAHVGQTERLAQQVLLVGPPVGRIGQDDAVGAAALSRRDRLDHPAQELGHEGVSRVRRAGHDDRGGVAEAVLELPDDPRGVSERPPGRGLATTMVSSSRTKITEGTVADCEPRLAISTRPSRAIAAAV